MADLMANGGLERAKMHILSVLLVALGLAGGSTASQQHSHKMADPLFGISYNPQFVKFEEAPETIGKLCRDLRGRDLWVYAHFKNAGAEYFIVSGFRKIYPDAPKAKPVGSEPDFGIAVLITGEKCTEDQSEYFLRQETNPARGATPIPASESVLEAIAADALQRYAKAFGGKEEFLSKLSAEDRQDAPPVLQKQIKAFEHSATSPHE